MVLLQVIVFFAILLPAVILYVLLRKSKKKKGPLVSGEEAMEVGANYLDGL